MQAYTFTPFDWILYVLLLMTFWKLWRPALHGNKAKKLQLMFCCALLAPYVGTALGQAVNSGK